MNNADLFIQCMNSDDFHDQFIARELPLTVDECHQIINAEPGLKQWVILNKKVPVQILEELSLDADEDIRWWVACKNAITPAIIERFITDPSTSVRHRLIYNKKVPLSVKLSLLYDEDEWLVNQAQEYLIRQGHLDDDPEESEGQR